MRDNFVFKDELVTSRTYSIILLACGARITRAYLAPRVLNARLRHDGSLATGLDISSLMAVDLAAARTSLLQLRR